MISPPQSSSNKERLKAFWNEKLAKLAEAQASHSDENNKDKRQPYSQGE